MPDLPAHTELIDGVLIPGIPQRVFHGQMIRLIDQGLRASKPAHLLVRDRMSVIVTPRQRLVPDILVIVREAETSLAQTWYSSAAVRLVVEVVSPETRERDFGRKAQLYAEAGIPHYWTVEEELGNPVVQVRDLDAMSARYELRGVHRGRLLVGAPYDIDIDLVMAAGS